MLTQGKDVTAYAYDKAAVEEALARSLDAHHTPEEQPATDTIKLIRGAHNTRGEEHLRVVAQHQLMLVCRSEEEEEE